MRVAIAVPVGLIRARSKNFLTGRLAPAPGVRLLRVTCDTQRNLCHTLLARTLDSEDDRHIAALLTVSGVQLSTVWWRAVAVGSCSQEVNHFCQRVGKLNICPGRQATRSVHAAQRLR